MTHSLMKGKRGLVMGVANDHSIAWGIAKKLHEHGAEVALTYQNEAFQRRVEPLVEQLSGLSFQCDVSSEGAIAKLAQSISSKLGSIDFIVHGIAFADKAELKGKYLSTSRANFQMALDISCYSFTELAAAFENHLNPGGALLTLTYEGSQRVMPSYNVMGIAKAALESSVRYLAHDLGPKNIRVNALSAGPMRTLAGAAIANARTTYKWQGDNSALRRNITMEEVANGGLYLLSDLSSGVTGEVMYVDGGYNTVGMMAVPE